MTKKIAILFILLFAVGIVLASVTSDIEQSSLHNRGMFTMPTYPDSSTITDSDMAALLGLTNFDANEPNSLSHRRLLWLHHHHHGAQKWND